MTRADKLLQEFGYDIYGGKYKPKKSNKNKNYRTRDDIKKEKEAKTKIKNGNIRKLHNAILSNNKFLIDARLKSDPSLGELAIGNFLASQNILFFREHTMKGLYNPITDKPLFFDFFIPEYNLVIEFDGVQHFKKCDNSDSKFDSIKYKDIIKNSFCRKRKINLLRIPYWERGRIEHIICEKCDQIKPNA